MARIAGTEIPSYKRGEIALTSVYGIGKSKAAQLLCALKIDLNKKARDWTEKECAQIRQYVADNYTVEGYLRGEERLNKKRLKDIRCYRGLRHQAGLPVRGQRTKTNARTRKGPRKTIANKKKATK